MSFPNIEIIESLFSQLPAPAVFGQGLAIITDRSNVMYYCNGAKWAPVGVPLGNNQKISIPSSRLAPVMRDSVRQVMASPPTVAWSSSNPISPFRQWAATDGNATVISNYFTFTRAAGFIADPGAFPHAYSVRGTNITYGNGNPALGVVGNFYNALSVSFIYTGISFAVNVQDYTGNVFIKVDDLYVSMTPYSLSNDGAGKYGLVTFATAGRRRIEIIFGAGGSGNFAGITTNPTDTIQPAAVRGPTCMFVGDSFTEGSATIPGNGNNYPVVFGELMGWDNIIGSGSGGTGYLTQYNSRPTYRQRLATDVIPYNPDIVFFTGGINDSAFTPAQIAAEATLCFQQIQAALPNALIVCVSPFLKTGASYAAPFLLQVRPLLKAAVQAVGGVFIDLQQMPLSNGVTPLSTTLTSASGAATTSLVTASPLVAGTTYQFADGTSVVVSSTSGTGPYTSVVDNSQNAQLVGATLTQVGPALWTGNGHVGATTGVGNCDILVNTDALHPTQAGHEAIAEAIASGFLNQLYSN